LFRETLVFVRSTSCVEHIILTREVPDSYVYVDWGPQFAQQHAIRFPGWSEASVHVGLGPLGLSVVLSAGGCGYFRLGVVRPYLATGELVIIEGAPTFEYPAFTVYTDENDNSAFQPALQALRDCSTAEESSQL